MSLYIGNLSSRVRKDELERLFRRFGNCTLQLKDGYGFAVYNFRSNAEKALRALRGRKICGQPTSVTWSNKQPRPLRRFPRGAQSFSMHRRRNFDRGNDHSLESNGQQDRPMSDHQLDDGVTRHKSVDMHEGGSMNHEYCRDPGEDFLDLGGDADMADNDRWGEKVDNFPNVDHVDNGLVFDRYEPDLDHVRIEEEENHRLTSREMIGRDRLSDAGFNGSDDPRYPSTCFKCGIPGHKMRDCPRKDSSRKRKSWRSDHGRQDEINQRSSRSKLLIRRKEPSRDRRKDSRGKMRREMEEETSKGHKGKKARRSVSSPLYSASVSNSFSSRSSSKSQRSNGRSINSMSWSRSSSPTSLSLSVSLGRPLPSPPNKTVEVPGEENLKLENPMVLVENEKTPLSIEEDHGKELCWDATDTRDISPENSSGMREHAGALEAECVPGAVEECSEPLPNACARNCLRISREELQRVLKHYGLEYSDEREGNLSVEDYFGSARLWPWEIVYYRRLKKGPVSTENYARRLAQNREHGITDRYIRGSSGWGESVQESA
ncbi:hypothetical protein Nepgr_030555 [Nepenthes gracilis]|uniref:Uncharacterized protein n=1 Tax=Nepenthes gracilis TaxID=150966 RepID=A0AAD3TH79_NEPGR|nr:hypothetical protein Nepgr_030555 [Nepenthes gracilis]